MDPACEAFSTTPLPFDSEQLGASVARLSIGATAAAWPEETLDKILGEHVQRWTRSGLWLVSCRIPGESARLGQALLRAGFREIETLVTFRRSCPEEAPAPSASSAVQAGQPADLVACLEIARCAFRFDRFHADPAIPRERADALKAAWVRNGLTGRADAALVVRDGERARGFALCMRSGRDAQIDLIAVAPDARGCGFGRALVDGALAHYAGRCEGMVVSTQASNEASLRLYSSAGFSRIRCAHTYHWVQANP